MFPFGNYPYFLPNYQNTSANEFFLCEPTTIVPTLQVFNNLQWIRYRNMFQYIQNNLVSQVQIPSNSLNSIATQELRVNSLQSSRQQRQRQKRIQNPSRNLKSNIFKIFFKQINDSAKFQQNYQILVNKLNLHYPIQEFRKELTEVLGPLQNYIRPLIIKRICSIQYPNKNLRLVLKNLLKGFIKEQVPLLMTNSQRKKCFRNINVAIQHDLLKIIEDEQEQE